MHTVRLGFERFSEISLYSAIGETGVYVLWSPKAQHRPTYIGEGWVLARLVEHQQTYGQRVDGYFAAADRDLTVKQAKRDQEIAEAALIVVGKMTGRNPRHNRNAGHVRRILELAGRHGVLKVVVQGRDPFQPPESPQSKLRGPRTIRFDLDGLYDGMDDLAEVIHHPWRTTR
ncbi:MAG: hypothetical protein R3B13_27115 [Polyangiaceae bacterium]